MTECKRCLLTDDILGVTIDDTGVCNFCHMHDELNAKYPISEKAIADMVSEIKRRGRKDDYDCLLGISGGADSSYLLHLAKTWGLRVLAFHVDNGFNSEIAEHNMAIMLKATGFPCVRLELPHETFIKLNKAVLMSGVSDADIPYDVGVMKMTLDLARKHRIKTMINGHSFRAEGIVPIGWTYMDGRYIQSLAEYGKVDISDYPVMTIWDQVKSMMYNMKHVRPLYHINHDKNAVMDFLVKEYGWKKYIGRHCENDYTAFAGWITQYRYGINKMVVEYSAQIRSDRITKREAFIALSSPSPKPDEAFIDGIFSQLPMTRREIDCVYWKPRRMFYTFNTYHSVFIRYKWAFWILTKLKLFPDTFYKKYTQKLSR